LSKISDHEVEIIPCPSDEFEWWDAFVEKSSAATISHVSAWRQIIFSAYGHKSFYLIALRSNEPVGILPLVWVKSALFGNSLASMPFQDYGGIVANDSVVAHALFEYAIGLRDKCKANYLDLRHRDEMIQGNSSLRKDKSTLILDISSGADDLWKTLSPKVRNQIRKAEKSGLTTKLGGPELLDDFYRVFATNMRDLGSPVHSFGFLSQVLAHFGKRARLLVVRDGQQVIGGLICLFHGATIAVPWASSLRQYFPKCPNNLLYWDAIRHACEAGCKDFDFGRSTIGSGTYNFKLQWGAKPVQLHWQVFSRNGASPVRPEADAKYRLSANIWRYMPVALTVYLGPRLRKYITN
jgi:serine/alanine adding enzyme